MDQRPGSAVEAQTEQGSAEICLTCTHLPSCALRAKQDAPIFFCDLFEEGEWSADIVAGLIEKHRDQRGGLISILEGVQAKYGYLPESALRLVADRTGRSLVDIYASPRSTEPSASCREDDTCARSAWGPPATSAILRRWSKELQNQLGVKPRETTEDREFSLETVNCLAPARSGRSWSSTVTTFPRSTPSYRRDPRKDQDRSRRGRGGNRRSGLPDRGFLCTLQPQLDGPQSPDRGPPLRQGHNLLRQKTRAGSGSRRSMAASPSSQRTRSPKTRSLNIFCPTCHAELAGATDCPRSAAAPMVPLIVRGGGMVQDLLAPWLLRSHLLDVSGLGRVGGWTMRRMLSTLDDLVRLPRTRFQRETSMTFRDTHPGGLRRNGRAGERRQRHSEDHQASHPRAEPGRQNRAEDHGMSGFLRDGSVHPRRTRAAPVSAVAYGRTFPESSRPLSGVMSRKS